MDIEIKEPEIKSLNSSPQRLSSYHNRPRSSYSYKKVLAESADPSIPVVYKGRYASARSRMEIVDQPS